jgi:hypothetical protein
MRKSLVAVAVLLLFSCGGIAQDKPSIHVVIQATPVQIKKAALAMFVRNHYSIDSDTPSQLKISKPFSDEETAAYNTAHWTNQPIANCRHVHAFLLSPTDDSTSVTMATEMVCHYGGAWMIRRNFDEKDSQFIHSTLADLKARTEETSQRP